MPLPQFIDLDQTNMCVTEQNQQLAVPYVQAIGITGDVCPTSRVESTRFTQGALP